MTIHHLAYPITFVSGAIVATLAAARWSKSELARVLAMGQKVEEARQDYEAATARANAVVSRATETAERAAELEADALRAKWGGNKSGIITLS